MLDFLKKIIKFLRKIIEYFLLFLIKMYQLFLSPFLGHNCNFRPTCSQYMFEAIKTHGIIKGIYLGIKRILKCTPNREFTYDPVPPKDKNKIY